VLATRYTACNMLTVSCTLWCWPLATSTANTDTVDNVSLLGLVTQTTSLIRARWAGSTVDDIQLSELYYAVSANVQRLYSKSIFFREKESPQFHDPNISSTPSIAHYKYIRRLYFERIDSVFEEYGIGYRSRFDLAYLPAADTEKESQNIGLLLLLQLFDVL
jgi:hypothetical protein